MLLDREIEGQTAVNYQAIGSHPVLSGMSRMGCEVIHRFIHISRGNHQ
jgi:hypothetical protein